MAEMEIVTEFPAYQPPEPVSPVLLEHAEHRSDIEEYLEARERHRSAEARHEALLWEQAH